MNVLLLGSGGREHALAIALTRSSLLETLFVAPGNSGIAAFAYTAALDLNNHSAIIAFCYTNQINLVVVGPELPLVNGIVDDLTAAGIKAFGPSQAAAWLEGSKIFAKVFCARYNIPTANYASFDNAASAKAYVSDKGTPLVIKADGLAEGKGVTVVTSFREAKALIDLMFAGKFGKAGKNILVEDFLKGKEVSFFALCDGTRAIEFASAQDYKRVGEYDSGPNTGGMGAYSPVPIMDMPMRERVMQSIIIPTLKGMAAMGAPYKGVLFAGLMICADGPRLIEYNVRFGDPETQVILPRLEEDLLGLLLACVEERLPEQPVRLSGKTALSVVFAAKGYPGMPVRGGEIRGLERAAAMPFISITQAGTKIQGQQLVADGGRVLNITGIGDDIAKARDSAYAAIKVIDWPDGFYRRDIGSA